MTIEPATLILAIVTLYFGIGAFIAVPLGVICLGFSGRLGWEPLAAFFAWPFMIVGRMPGVGMVVIGLMLVGSMVGLTWFALTYLGLRG